MPDEQLTSDEWSELYRYLLTRLEEHGLASVRADIEVVAAAPVFEESTREENIRISRIVRGEVGKATMRSRNPSEMFAAALEVLRARLNELPRIAEAITVHLQRPATEIEFRLDTPTQSDPIPLTRLSVSPTEAIPIGDLLIRLGIQPERIRDR